VTYELVDHHSAQHRRRRRDSHQVRRRASLYSVSTSANSPSLPLRSDCCTISYLNNPSATLESFTPEGWFATGDVGKLDARGNLYITDRLKELVKVKG